MNGGFDPAIHHAGVDFRSIKSWYLIPSVNVMVINNSRLHMSVHYGGVTIVTGPSAISYGAMNLIACQNIE